MKTVLGVILRNEEFMLRRHLPVVSGSFDGAIFLDDFSTDNSAKAIEESCKCPFEIIRPEAPLVSFSDRRNRVIKRAEETGFEVMFMLDADECMFPEEIESVKSRMGSSRVIALPRYEFAPDFDHYNPSVYPDFQARVFLLNQGYEYRNNVHEILCVKGQEYCVSDQNALDYAEKEHLYHYGRCKDAKNQWIKDNNYNRILAGLEPIEPDLTGQEIKIADIWLNTPIFEGKQPINS